MQLNAIEHACAQPHLGPMISYRGPKCQDFVNGCAKNLLGVDMYA